MVTEDVDLAQKIYGEDIVVLKRKSTRPEIKVVTKEHVIELPEELQIAETELAIDVVFIEKEAFLHALDQKIKGKSIVPL